VENAGRLDGFAVYFRTLVDDDLVLSSSPLDPGRAPHWGFRILRTDGATFAQGDVIEFTLTVEQWAKPNTWRWHVQKAAGPAAEIVRRHDGA
jgi:protein arginine N-methyltransferase 1